ncbi:MAG: EamA family transporter [Pseudomonadota bacterium]
MNEQAQPHGADDAHAQRRMLVGVLVLVLAGIILGFAPILVKLSDLGPQAIAFWRLLFSLPALTIWLWLEERRFTSRETLDKRALVLAGVFFAFDLAFWHAGIKITTAANATLLANLTPILVAVGAWALFSEKITARFLIASAIALIGAVLLAAANISIAPERLAGDILSALTSAWYAAYILAVRFARRYASSSRIMLWTSAVAAPIALVITLIFDEPFLPQSAAGWLPLLALGLIVHIGGQGGLAFGLGRVPAALAALIILIQPVVAATLGWFLFGESLIAVQIFGAGLVLVGVYAAQRTSMRRRKRPPIAKNR